MRGINAAVPRIAEPVEELVQLVGGQQVEEHEDVRLLGQLVAVGGVALCLKDAVEAADVAVPLGVVGPVELLEPLVPPELAEDPVVVPAQPQPAADVVPPLQFGAADPQHVQQFVPPALGQHLEVVERPGERPGGHHVGVGVVVQPRLVPPGYRVVELVGSHQPRAGRTGRRPRS